MIRCLIGHRGVGKTTLLARLQELYTRYQKPGCFLDLDKEIERRSGRAIASIFQEHGQDVFRRRERETLQALVAEMSARSEDVFIAVGAGYEGVFPKDVEVVWVRRATDSDGRIFLNRPPLTDLSPLEEWRRFYPEREQRYSEASDWTLFLPEGTFHPPVLEEQAFGLNVHAIPFDFTLSARGIRHVERYLSWQVRRLELRDDWLSNGEIRSVLEKAGPERCLYAVRSQRLVQPPTGFVHTDWPLEFGAPPWTPWCLSLHERDADLQITLDRMRDLNKSVVKLAVEIRSFNELLLAHRWWMEDPSHRAFLPRSKDGRWQWYRQIFGPRMPIHFFREGNGSSEDQPRLWETLSTPPEASSFAAILGDPVTHSWTPSFHQAFFSKRQMPVVRIAINEEDWSDAWPILQDLGLQAAAVTSPLKLRAFENLDKATPAAQDLRACNTLVRTAAGWRGDNTDLSGAEALLRRAMEGELVMWGGGGVRDMIRRVRPQARLVPARTGGHLEKETSLIWAVPAHRSVRWPEPLSRVRQVLDLNYAENSPGLELALRAKSAYVSGREMFVAQAEHQQRFWKDYL